MTPGETIIEPEDQVIVNKEENSFDPQAEEAKRRQQFLDYANDILKVKKLPREFGHKTLKGIINTQYAGLNRKQRRAELARLQKQMDNRLKVVAKQKKIIEEFQEEMNENLIVPSQSQE